MASARPWADRIGRAFLLQAAIIVVAAVGGVMLARVAIIDLLNSRALELEASDFWRRHQVDPGVSPPMTRNLTAYLAPIERLEAVPPALRALPPGLHHQAKAGGNQLVSVSDQQGKRLFMVLDASNIDSLTFYFGLVPLTITLIVLYLSAWLVHRLVSRAVSPVMRLATAVGSMNIESPNANDFALPEPYAKLDDEVLMLSRALQSLTGRINQFVERERNFTRDASHELRSPLTVIRLASDRIAREATLSDDQRATIERIQRAVREMEETTEVFLLLARESDQGLQRRSIRVNDLVREEIDRARWLRPDGASIELVEQAHIEVEAPQRVLAVLIGNVLRNAVLHSHGSHVRVTITAQDVRVADQGPGIAPEKVQALFERPMGLSEPAAELHGVGLNLVKRLSDRFGWSVAVDSRAGQGTEFLIRLPGARPIRTDV